MGFYHMKTYHIRKSFRLWGSRGREFKSRHSDQQKALNPNGFKAFFIFTAGMETAEKCTKSAQNVHIAEKTP